MPLPDYEIAKLAQTGMIEPFNSKRLNSFGYDITLGNKFMIPEFIICGIPVDPMKFDASLMVKKEHKQFCLVKPNSYILGCSLEYFKIPNDILGICIGRSSYARCGININITPLEPGWEGNITVEIISNNYLPVKVYVNKGIAQIIFFRGELPNKNYVAKGGRYQGQTEVTLPKGV